MVALLAACQPADPGVVTDRPIPPGIAYEPRIKVYDAERDEAGLRKRVARGDTWAMGRLAWVLYEQAYQPTPEALALLRQAAAKGDVQAWALLGEWLNPPWIEAWIPTWLDEKVKDWSWSFNVGGDRPRPR